MLILENEAIYVWNSDVRLLRADLRTGKKKHSIPKGKTGTVGLDAKNENKSTKADEMALLTVSFIIILIVIIYLFKH